MNCYHSFWINSVTNIEEKREIWLKKNSGVSIKVVCGFRPGKDNEENCQDSKL